jgi:hypothetical protein
MAAFSGQRSGKLETSPCAVYIADHHFDTSQQFALVFARAFRENGEGVTSTGIPPSLCRSGGLTSLHKTELAVKTQMYQREKYRLS